MLKKAAEERLSAWLNNPELAIPSMPIAMELNNYAVLACQGPDAKKFLQGQFTCNLDEISAGQNLLGAYCDHKGRLLANFWIAQNQQGYLLVFPRNIYDSFYKELKKFATFSKVELVDVSADYQQIGFVTTNDMAIADCSLKYTYNNLSHALFEKSYLMNSLANFSFIDQSYWELLNIRNGLITIVPETVGLFTPHEINFVQIGGVSFNKGCYRGQEIIARMHYLGKLKQHLYHCTLQTSEKLNAGRELITAEQQHLGKVVNCIELDDGYYEILAVLYDAIVAEQQQIKLDKNSALNVFKKFGS